VGFKAKRLRWRRRSTPYSRRRIDLIKTRLLYVSHCVILLFSLTVTSGVLHAQENQGLEGIESRVDEIFAECSKPGSPGAAVAILKNGQVVLSKGHGSAQPEHDIPITPTTVFWIASVSKQFTAMATTMLEEQGKLSIDDEIHTYLHEIPDFGEPITIRHLLHHTSGLRDDLTLWVLAGNHIEDVITQEDLLSMLRRQKQLNFSPGSQCGYSDTNYNLLAEIVFRVTGESFSTWVKRNIFLPLGMTSSRFVEHYAELIQNRAHCYKTYDAGGFRNSSLSMGLADATGMMTTVEDMIKWSANFETREVGGDKVLEAMLTRGVLNSGEQITYARGLTVESYHGRKMIKHSGTDAGFSSHMAYFPDERLGLVVLSNFPSNPWDLGNEVADLFLNRGPDEPYEREQQESRAPSRSEAAAVALTGDRLAACTGSYWYEESWKWLVRDIVAEDSKFYYLRSADSRSELIPLSAHEFLLAGTDDTVVRFSDKENGRFTNLTFDATGPEPSNALRVERFEPGDDELREYEGLYYADELDALQLRTCYSRNRIRQGVLGTNFGRSVYLSCFLKHSSP
jgi:CubicO group peptidase (beta-lactamase class C family)